MPSSPNNPTRHQASAGQSHSGELLSFEPTALKPGHTNTALHEGILNDAATLAGIHCNCCSDQRRAPVLVASPHPPRYRDHQKTEGVSLMVKGGLMLVRECGFIRESGREYLREVLRTPEW